MAYRGTEISARSAEALGLGGEWEQVPRRVGNLKRLPMAPIQGSFIGDIGDMCTGKKRVNRNIEFCVLRISTISLMMQYPCRVLMYNGIIGSALVGSSRRARRAGMHSTRDLHYLRPSARVIPTVPKTV